MPNNASLTMMRSSAPGLRDAEAKRQSAAFWSGTATNAVDQSRAGPCIGQSGGAFSIFAGQRSCGVKKFRQILPGSKFQIAVGPPVEPSIARTWPADILTIDGQIQKTFHILIPRWRLTNGRYYDIVCAKACEMGLEGIVSKRVVSRYCQEGSLPRKASRAANAPLTSAVQRSMFPNPSPREFLAHAADGHNHKLF